MPQLLYLIEGHPFTAATVREEKPESPAVRAALGGPATHRQREALKAALNTPDICLIQGPPGTGKSTVIAALQARLAEISADPADFSRSTLLSSFQHEAVEHVVAKTRILGLPGLKIGRRFGSGDGARLPAFETWKHEIAAAIRTRTSVGEGFHQLQLAKLLRAKMMLPLTPAEQVVCLRQAEAIAPSALAARLAAAAGQIELSLRAPAEDRWVTHLRQCAMELGEDTTGTSVRLTAAINIVNLLEANDRTVDPALAELAAWSTPDEPDADLWLHAIEASAAELPSGVHPSGAARVPPSEQQLILLTDLVDDLTSELSRSQEGPALVALEFADRLDHDPEGAEEIARRYSAVLAATCQQAASQDLVEIKESSDPVFENVIIDEAARANPLDLLIPMSMGRRRIILVGDHRQLPQMLEPDVEREVRRSIGDEHAERLKQSLFERLFDQLKALEDETGVKRVVTLDTQFRMHRRLAEYVSDTFYRADGGLHSHPSTDALTHQIGPYEGRVAAWIDVPLSAGAERSARPGWSRPVEATQVAEVVEDVATRAPDLSIGVITFYADQSRLISAELERRGLMYRADDGAWVARRPGSTRSSGWEPSTRSRGRSLTWSSCRRSDRTIERSLARRINVGSGASSLCRTGCASQLAGSGACCSSSAIPRWPVVPRPSGHRSSVTCAGSATRRPSVESETDLAMTVADWAKVRLPFAKRIEALLWPVLAYDVLVPIDEPSDLNIVQRAVLDLAFCGIRDPVVIAEHLQLDPDLMVIVLTELEGRNLLDDQRVPTDAARHHAEQEAARMAVRVVFQDPFTGQLWPFAAEQVVVAPIEWKDGRRRLAVGGKTWPVVRVETGERSQPSPPAAREILAAVRARPRHPEDSEAGGEPLFEAPERVARVEVVSEQPASWLMPVVFYLPNPPDDVDGIVAIGIDGWPSSLLGHFMEVAARTDVIADRVRRRLDQEALDAHIGPHREYLARARADAEFDIERQVDGRWREDPVLWGALVTLQSQIFEAESDAPRAERLLGDAMTGAGRMFERLSKMLNQRFPLPPAVEQQLRTNGNRLKRGKLIEAPVVLPNLAEARSSWASGSVPESLDGAGEQKGPTGLAWHLARLVVAANYDQAHPLREILRVDPDWLHGVVRTARFRNQASHDADTADATTVLEGARRALELAVTALHHALPPGGSNGS